MRKAISLLQQSGQVPQPKPRFNEIETGYLHRSISQPMTRRRRAEFRVLERYLGRELAIQKFQEKFVFFLKKKDLFFFTRQKDIQIRLDVNALFVLNSIRKQEL